ncbi:MAG: DegV family protein [Oscillibacter sp.]|nr:DegV family protein [Oscillibacter sp.]
MSSLILLAETGSDITPEIARRYGIRLVPMHVTFDTRTVDDGSFDPEEIRTYYRTTGKLPTTSGSTPEDFTVVFDAIHAEDPEAHILYLA